MKKIIFIILLLTISSLNAWSKEMFCIKNDCCTEKEINAFLNLLPPYFKTDKQELCKALLRMSLVKQEAKQNGFLSRKDIKTKLKIEEYRTLYRLYMEDVVKRTKVTDNMLKSYYLSHIDKFSIPKTYKLKIMYLKKQPSPPFSISNLKKIAQNISNEDCADTKIVTLFGKRFENEIVKLKKGECIVINGNSKWTSICLENIQEPKPIPFEKVKHNIKKKLLDLKGGWIVKREIKRLLKKYHPEIKDKKCAIQN